MLHCESYLACRCSGTQRRTRVTGTGRAPVVKHSDPRSAACARCSLRYHARHERSAYSSRCEGRFDCDKGFGDCLRIGEQNRPDLFALEIEKPQPLTDHVLEIDDERLTADGDMLIPLDLNSIG